MITVIGLGSAGCNLAEMFEQIKEFNVKLIDSDIEGENCFSLPVFNNPEEYENSLPDLTNFLQDCTKKVLFIVGGGGKVSGATLKILSTIKDKEISVLYIRPDKTLLDTVGELQDNLAFNVLQEYARSGIFKDIYLVSNLNIESILGDIPPYEYFKNLNKVIYNIIYNLFVCETQKPIIDTVIKPKEYSRILTFGVYDIQEDIEKYFYDISNIDNKVYYFIINENQLKTDGKLFKTIKENIKQKNTDQTKVSYKIFSTPHEQNYCYVINYSRVIQQ